MPAERPHRAYNSTRSTSRFFSYSGSRNSFDLKDVSDSASIKKIFLTSVETQTEGSTAEVATQTNIPTRTSIRKPRVKCYFCKGPHTQKDCVRRANHQHRVLQSQATTATLTTATINTDARQSKCEKSEPGQWELATEDLELEFRLQV